MTAGAVVVLPGLGEAACDWDAVLALLPPDVRVTVVDPGPPPRPRPRHEWRPDAVARRLREALAGTPRPWLLVGHSSGALQVQALLYADAASCAGAVLVDGEVAGTWRPRTTGRRLRLEVVLWSAKRSARTRVADQAERLAAHRGVDLAGVDID